MTSYAAAASAAVLVLQSLLTSFENSLAPEAYLCPTTTSIDTVLSNDYDIMIVGGGTAGLTLAHRVAVSNPNISILVIEQAEGCAPFESVMPAYFTLLPNTTYDRKMKMYNDSFSCQNLKPDSGILTAGNMLGGSSGLEHMIYVSPFPSDYDSWATAANDSSWSYSEIAKYFAIGENVQDACVLKQNAILHGTSGPQILSKQVNSKMNNFISALEELGYNYVSDPAVAGDVSHPLLNVGDDCNGMRQGGVEAYLSKLINKTQVTILTGATANKLFFNDTTATQLEVSVDEVTYNLTVKKDVVLSMGALKTPQFLMLSGIGDGDDLAELGIETVINNTQVGKNLMDHLGIMVTYCMEDSNEATTTNPHKFPADMITSYGGSTINGTIEYQAITLGFPPLSAGFLQLCGTVFKYTDAICDAMYQCNLNRTIAVAILNLSKPNSRGNVSLTSTNMKDDPEIRLNLMYDRSDLRTLAEMAMNFDSIRNTTVFKEIGVTMADPGVCADEVKETIEYWECYTQAMSSTMWHYSGTAAMGTVVDSNLLVKGTSNVMAVDASIFPTIPGANIMSTVRMVGEMKAAEILKSYA